MNRFLQYVGKRIKKGDKERNGKQCLFYQRIEDSRVRHKKNFIELESEDLKKCILFGCPPFSAQC